MPNAPDLPRREGKDCYRRLSPQASERLAPLTGERYHRNGWGCETPGGAKAQQRWGERPSMAPPADGQRQGQTPRALLPVRALRGAGRERLLGEGQQASRKERGCQFSAEASGRAWRLRAISCDQARGPLRGHVWSASDSNPRKKATSSRKGASRPMGLEVCGNIELFAV